MNVSSNASHTIETELTRLRQENKHLRESNESMVDMLLRTEIQLEYIQGKFGTTGTSTQTLAQIRAVIEKATNQ